MLGASVTAEIAQQTPLNLGGGGVGYKGGQVISAFRKPLGAFLTALLLGMGEKGVMQKAAQLGSNEQHQEGNQSLLASKMHS